jgi:hypothetical protein
MDCEDKHTYRTTVPVGAGGSGRPSELGRAPWVAPVTEPLAWVADVLFKSEDIVDVVMALRILSKRVPSSPYEFD